MYMDFVFESIPLFVHSIVMLKSTHSTENVHNTIVKNIVIKINRNPHFYILMQRMYYNKINTYWASFLKES